MNNVRRFLVVIDRQLFQPSPSLPAALHRRSRLLGGLLLTLFLLVVFSLVASYLANPGGELLPGAYRTVTLVGSALLVLAYGLNRTGRYWPAAVLMVGLAAAGVWSGILGNRETFDPNATQIPYVLLSVLLSSLLLSARATALLMAVHLGGLLLIPSLIPAVSPAAFTSLFVFVSFLGLLIVVSASLSRRAQADLEAQTRAHQESEERFRLLFAASPDAIVLIDPRSDPTPWAIVDCNDVACQMNGYAREAMIGQSIDLLNERPGTPEERAAYLQRIRQSGTIHLEAIHRHKDGRLFAVEISTSLISLGGRELILGIDRDVTERRQAEAALQESNEKLTQWLGEMEQRTREVALLNEMSEMLQACVSSAEAYAVIAQMGRHFFPDESGALCVQSASRNLVERVCMWGTGEGEEVGQAVFAPDDCWALRRGRLYASGPGQPVLPCQHAGSDNGHGCLCVPMLGHDGSLGVFHLQRRAPGPIDEARRRLAQTVADSVALALSNLSLRETLRHQSVRDPLTGLFNRRYLEETLDREVRRVARSHRTLGVIMLDIDHFKAFNDTFGHEAGDAVLREFGGFLRAHVRAEDIACRYGGEEFVVVLPDASLELTAQRAEQLREGVKRLMVPGHGQVLGAISISLGVAYYPEHGHTAEALLRAADAALYRAKREQRDRVVIAE